MADAGDSDSDSTQSPEGAEEDMSSGLGVGALDEEVNQLLQEVQEVPLPTLASATNHLESGTNTW